MAEIIPFEPDTDNAGVGMATQKRLSEPYPMKAKGYGFFSETPIAQA